MSAHVLFLHTLEGGWAALHNLHHVVNNRDDVVVLCQLERWLRNERLISARRPRNGAICGEPQEPCRFEVLPPCDGEDSRAD